MSGGPTRPEERLGSTTTRFSQGENGLSQLTRGELQREVIESDPVAWLGARQVEAFGASTEILVKLLKLDQGLPVRYYPDQKFAAETMAEISQLNHV